MLPKQDIMLKLAEIEESLNQLEQRLYDRVSAEDREGSARLENQLQKLDIKMSGIERKVGSTTNNNWEKENVFMMQKLELSYKTS
ncbi:hypothetical protein [Rossellomorea aquimaris]|uniref:hypothetical protein n=1 Tax=Rossellomorea aquimaris TaxID=189382 RepID=UPI0007D0B570|nr:hypothetical protein [Rossellomorea aquimaris]